MTEEERKILEVLRCTKSLLEIGPYEGELSSTGRVVGLIDREIRKIERASGDDYSYCHPCGVETGKTDTRCNVCGDETVPERPGGETLCEPPMAETSLPFSTQSPLNPTAYAGYHPGIVQGYGRDGRHPDEPLSYVFEIISTHPVHQTVSITIRDAPPLIFDVRYGDKIDWSALRRAHPHLWKKYPGDRL